MTKLSSAEVEEVFNNFTIDISDKDIYCYYKHPENINNYVKFKCMELSPSTAMDRNGPTYIDKHMTNAYYRLGKMFEGEFSALLSNDAEEFFSSYGIDIEDYHEYYIGVVPEKLESIAKTLFLHGMEEFTGETTGVVEKIIGYGSDPGRPLKPFEYLIED